MMYWMAEVFDFTKRDVPCIQRLVGRGTTDSFLMFLQGMGAKEEKQGLWVYNDALVGIEVTLILPSEYMEHRNHGLRFSDMVARMSEDVSNHAMLDEMVEREIVAEVFDNVYGLEAPLTNEVIRLA